MGADATIWINTPKAARKAILEHFEAWDPRYSEPVPFFSTWPKPTFEVTEGAITIGGSTYMMGHLSDTGTKAVRVIHMGTTHLQSHFLPPAD
jgi:hypothetical protein